MSKNRELVKNTLILTVGKICTQFVSFFLLPLYTARLSPAEYGIVDMFSTYVVLLVPIVGWQIDQGMFRYILNVRNSKEKMAVLFSQVIVINILQSITVFIVYFVVARWIPTDYKIYVVEGIILNIFSSTLMQFARGLGKIVHYSISSFLMATITIAFNILLILGLNMQAEGMLIATLAGYFINIMYLIFALKIWQYLRWPDLKDYQVKEILQYSLPLVPNQISGWVMSVSDRVVINFFLGTAINGIYTISNKFTNLIITFFGFFHISWVESVSLHIHDEDWNDYINSTITKVFQMFFCICLLLLVVMPFVFSKLINSAYIDSYLQIPILTVAVIIQIYIGLLSAIYLAIKRTDAIAKTTIAGAVINIVVNLSLVNYIGLYAASVSTLVANLALAIYRTIDLKRHVKIKFDKRIILTDIILLITVLSSYYLKLYWNNILCTIVVFGYAVRTYQDIFANFLGIMRKKFRKNKYEY